MKSFLVIIFQFVFIATSLFSQDYSVIFDTTWNSNNINTLSWASIDKYNNTYTYLSDYNTHNVHQKRNQNNELIWELDANKFTSLIGFDEYQNPFYVGNTQTHYFYKLNKNDRSIIDSFPRIIESGYLSGFNIQFLSDSCYYITTIAGAYPRILKYSNDMEFIWSKDLIQHPKSIKLIENKIVALNNSLLILNAINGDITYQSASDVDILLADLEISNNTVYYSAAKRNELSSDDYYIKKISLERLEDSIYTHHGEIINNNYDEIEILNGNIFIKSYDNKCLYKLNSQGVLLDSILFTWPNYNSSSEYCRLKVIDYFIYVFHAKYNEENYLVKAITILDEDLTIIQEWIDEINYPSIMNYWQNIEISEGGCFVMSGRQGVSDTVANARIKKYCRTGFVNEDPNASISKIDSDLFSIYPNPTSCSFTVNLNKESNFENLVIYNSLGQKMITKTISNTTEILNTSNFPKGIYSIQVGTSQQKLVIE